MKVEKKFTVIGGGTGTYSVLSGLKIYTKNITAIVSMADSGGSARKERDEWGLLPSSDIRKSLIALSDVSQKDSLLLRKLFEYRYDQGVGITGMTFGNLYLVALTKLLGSQEKAIEKAGKILKIRGKVLPVTLEKVDLMALYEDGSKIIGEHFIDEPVHNGFIKIKSLTTHPVATINPVAQKAILDSDVIIIGPGGFYTTILANLVVPGVPEAICKSKAKIFFIQNLMTEYGQTYKFSAGDFLHELSKYIPKGRLDYVFINNAPIPVSALKKYKKFHAIPVKNDFKPSTSFQIISGDFLSPKIIRKKKGDSLQRSFIRHDGDKIAAKCMELLHLV